ncbi:hypothetical protein [Pedobacter superstes]|uniref:hypothetical protein n=1 Tax=Pedobacter superstes TaxID=3133441 RepID=UPI003D725564
MIQREVVDRIEFDSFYHAKHTLAAHRNWYDSRRRHRNIGMTPLQKWKQNIHITEHKRAEKKERQDITEMAAELPANINKYYTTSSLLLSN